MMPSSGRQALSCVGQLQSWRIIVVQMRSDQLEKAMFALD
jgi:nitroreductase